MKKTLALLALLLTACVGEDYSYCEQGKQFKIDNGQVTAQGKVIGIQDYKGSKFCHAEITAGNSTVKYYFKANETESYTIEARGGSIFEVHTINKDYAAFCQEKIIEAVEGENRQVTKQKKSLYEGHECCVLETTRNEILLERSCATQDSSYLALEQYQGALLFRKVVQDGNCATVYENGNSTTKCTK